MTDDYTQEYEIGSKVRFKNKDDDMEYIGTILIFYRHNGLYEIEIEDRLDVSPKNVTEMPEVGACPSELIYETLD